jgi:hypothetical protein
MPILSGRSLWTRGRRWYAYAHVARDTIADVVRVDAPGARIRHVDSRAVFVSLRDDLGVWRLLRYPHAVPECMPSRG